MSKIINKRNNFLSEFKKLLKDENLELLEEWGKIPFPEDTSMAAWYSKEKKKAMRIQENDEASKITFDAFTYHGRGEDDDITEVVLLLSNTDGYTKEIFEIYKTWFFTGITQNEMDDILEKYMKRINKR